jgi:hypothetical protein
VEGPASNAAAVSVPEPRGGRHRHDAGARSVVPGGRAGRELRHPLARAKGRLVELATRRRSASTIARAAATSPSSWACVRTMRATTRYPFPRPEMDATAAYIRGAGEIRRDVPGRRRELRLPRARRPPAPVDRRRGATDRPRTRDGQGIHRAPVERFAPRAVRGRRRRSSD